MVLYLISADHYTLKVLPYYSALSHLCLFSQLSWSVSGGNVKNYSGGLWEPYVNKTFPVIIKFHQTPGTASRGCITDYKNRSGI